MCERSPHHYRTWGEIRVLRWILQRQKKNNPQFAFQAPEAENKQRFLERDTLNTLAVGYSYAEQLCEISCSEMPSINFEPFENQMCARSTGVG